MKSRLSTIVRPQPVARTESPAELWSLTSPPPVTWPRFTSSAVLLAETPPAKSMDAPVEVSTSMRAKNATGELNTCAPLSATRGNDRALSAVAIRSIPPENV